MSKNRHNMDIQKAQDFMELVGKLKHLSRTGWTRLNIQSPESVASHMYRMAMLSFLVDKNDNLDRNKIMQMTLVHDLAECLVGDITPHDGIPVNVKHRMEDDAMVSICKNIGGNGDEILNLFREYEAQASPEARYVKDLDRLDLISQAYEYEERDKKPGTLEEFFSNTIDKIENSALKNWATEIMRRRSKIEKDDNVKPKD